ncbi:MULTISPECIES: nucleotidyltransferase family protein [Sphingomonas]|uniref:nucleotidyltransferase family protein n=1 Tax=Sphingomonas TaxID=13687 RepID=UPI000DEFABD0|nr:MULTISPECIES: nucleotidyltransferase family protein [Sphingomonas]
MPPPLTASPALRWLAAACRQDGAPLGAPPLAWADLISLACRHRVQSLLHAGLTARGVAVPDALTADAQAIAADNLRAAVEYGRLHRTFVDAGLPLLFVKGLPLSQLAYGRATLKLSRDIDLLVRPADVVAAGRLLLDLDYHPQDGVTLARLAAWHRHSKESGWLHPTGLLVELHSRLTDSPRLLPGLGADRPGPSVPIAPGIAVPTLPSEALLAYLAVHGASSAWFRLKWLADFHALLGDRDPAALHAAMRDAGAGRAAGLALLLCQAVYDLPLSQTLNPDRATRWLAAEALRQLDHPSEPTARRGGTLGIHLSQLLIGESWSFPLTEGVRRTREILFRRLSPG